MQQSLFENSVMSYSNLQDKFLEKYRSRFDALQAVIIKLRNEDLNKGYCFLIFDDTLPEEQAFYEYPDGRICIEKLDKRNIEIPRTVIKVLNKTEAAAVREKHVFTR